jgi:outer membrane protein TolC
MSFARSSIHIAFLGMVCVCGLGGGCARQPYVARPLTLPDDAQIHASRSLASAELLAYLQRHGATDPAPKQWGLSELTLVALFYRQDLHAARASARAARAEALQAAQRPPLGVTPRIENHSADGARDTPWSLGFELELPLAFASRREPLVRRAQAQAEAAELGVGAMAWRLRSEVRARLLESWGARGRLSSERAEADALQAVLAMLEKRRELGYASSSEVQALRLRLADAQAAAATAQSEAQLALGRLAEAAGLPLSALQEATLSFAVFSELPDVADAEEARASALRNRTDMRRSLLDFEAADAAVKLEVARQYPTIALRPGYLWDQGDNVWSLALDLVLPAHLVHRAGIRATEERREAAARQALAAQQTIMSEADTRLVTYQASRAAVLAAEAAAGIQAARVEQIERQFDTGQVDRLERTLGGLETILAQRRVDAARLEAQRALGLLEDAMQIPVVGGPLPAPPEQAGRG